jgi:hypothetical protein
VSWQLVNARLIKDEFQWMSNLVLEFAGGEFVPIVADEELDFVLA